jgi:hypothetical protein
MSATFLFYLIHARVKPIEKKWVLEENEEVYSSLLLANHESE